MRTQKLNNFQKILNAFGRRRKKDRKCDNFFLMWSSNIQHARQGLLSPVALRADGGKTMLRYNQ